MLRICPSMTLIVEQEVKSQIYPLKDCPVLPKMLPKKLPKKLGFTPLLAVK